jgi:hypothetical protein
MWHSVLGGEPLALTQKTKKVGRLAPANGPSFVPTLFQNRQQLVAEAREANRL